MNTSKLDLIPVVFSEPNCTTTNKYKRNLTMIPHANEETGRRQRVCIVNIYGICNIAILGWKTNLSTAIYCLVRI